MCRTNPMHAIPACSLEPNHTSDRRPSIDVSPQQRKKRAPPPFTLAPACGSRNNCFDTQRRNRYASERTESVSIFQIPMGRAYVIPGDRMLTPRSGNRVAVHYALPGPLWTMNAGALLAKDGGYRYPRQLMRSQLDAGNKTLKTAGVIKSFARDEKGDTTRKRSSSASDAFQPSSYNKGRTADPVTSNHQAQAETPRRVGAKTSYTSPAKQTPSTPGRPGTLIQRHRRKEVPSPQRWEHGATYKWGRVRTSGLQSKWRQRV